MGAVTAAIVGGAALGSTLLASQASRQGAEAQRRAAEAAAAAFAGVPIPTVEEQKIILQTPELMGQYTPEQLQAMELGVSAMEGVKADQGAIDAQKQALEGISEVAEGGYSEADKATAREVQRTVSQDAQARQKAILNSMAQRGVLGSGMELAAQLQSQQQSADQMSRAGDNLTQQAQARALAALGQQGSLAGQLRQQSFGEQSDVARARDAINQFNTQNRQSVTNQNVGNRNQAQLTNLQNRQAIENQRAGLANEQERYNKGLIQQQFDNRTGRVRDTNAANMAAANARAQQSQADAAMYQGIGSAIGTAAGGIGSYYGKQQDHKNALELAQVNSINRPGRSYRLPASNNDDPFGTNT